MADLTDLQAAETIKIVGANSSGVETNAVNASANGDLTTVDGLRNGGVFGTLSIPTANTAVEAKVGGSRLVNRKSLVIIPQDDMFWGYDNTVTISNGMPIKKDQVLIFSIDANSTFQVWLVASANSKNAKIAESP